jgi:hypothetical protein
VDRLGWSNLLKIGHCEEDYPKSWPRVLQDQQSSACIVALNEELNKLHDSLIVIASDCEFGILWKIIPEADWDKRYKASGIYWHKDLKSQNLLVHCYHPKAMKIGRFEKAALRDILRLARAHLKPLAI